MVADLSSRSETYLEPIRELIVEVTFMRQVGDRRLWIGHAGDLREARAVLAAGIEAVMELADSEPFAKLPRELVRCRFPLSDGGSNSAWLLRLAAETLASLLRARVPTLVCCASGLSRSVCLAAAGMALAESIPLRDALDLVAETGPADVSPGLLAEIQEALER